MRLRSKREQKNHKSNSWFIHSILFHSLCVRLNLVEEFKRKCRLFCSHCNAIRFDIQFNSIQSEILSFFVKFPNIKNTLFLLPPSNFMGSNTFFIGFLWIRRRFGKYTQKNHFQLIIPCTLYMKSFQKRTAKKQSNKWMEMSSFISFSHHCSSKFRIVIGISQFSWKISSLTCTLPSSIFKKNRSKQTNKQN